MGVLGEMFPGAKIQDESSEAGDGQGWRLGPIDLDNNVVVLHRGAESEADRDDSGTGQTVAVRAALPHGDGSVERHRIPEA